jgi:iron complex transport system permease protein
MTTPPIRKRFWTTVGWSAALLLVTIVFAPLVGPHLIDPRVALTNPNSLDGRILLVARLPRVLLGALAGGALAVCGATFQALLRNPLAEPFTLGVSSGASMGAVLAILLGLDIEIAGLTAVPAFAFGGGLLAVLAVYWLARTGRGRAGRSSHSPLQTSTLLLAGVCLAFCFHSVILLAHYLADYGNSYRMLRWLMGGLGVTSFRAVLQVLPFAVTGLALVWAVSRDLNLLSGSEPVATTRGVDVRSTQKIAYFAASLSTAAVVTAVGPIGFVGLMVPHVARRAVGPDHRLLLPASFGVGGAFLVVCDTVARTLLAPTELPVGVVTALIGGPFTVAILVKSQRKK